MLLVEERTGCSLMCVWGIIKSYYRTIGKEYMLEHTLLVLCGDKIVLKDPGG